MIHSAFKFVPNLDDHMKDFCQLYHFTPREFDVLKCVISNHSQDVAIAKHLGVSPNTVSNHVKSMLAKSGITNKTELVASFLSYLYKKFETFAQLVKMPTVLIVEDEKEMQEELAHFLKKRGLTKIYQTADPEEAKTIIFERRVDVVLLDIRLPKFDGLELLRQVRSSLKSYPSIILITGFPDYTLDKCLDLGASDLIKKPASPELIFSIVLQQFFEHELLTKQEVPAGVTLELSAQIPVKQLGFGGFFISQEQLVGQFDKVHAGDLIQVKLNIEGSLQVKAICEIAWKRHTPTDNGVPGLGMRFKKIEAPDLMKVEDLVLGCKTIAFVPQNI